MKKSRIRSRKFRYGSIAITMSALVVAVVIMLNAGISALANKYGWFTDMTKKNMYSLTGACTDLLRENIDQTVKDRENANKEMPKTNFAMAENNIDRMESNLEIAGTNIERADKNISLAERNRELFSKSVSLAEDNLEIANENLALAERINEFAMEKEKEVKENNDSGEEAVKQAEKNAADAGALLEEAKKNVEKAEKNVETAARNRLSASGYTQLEEFAQLETPENYKYFGAFAVQINDTDTDTAAENRRIADSNKAIAAENIAIAKENLEIARSNMNAGKVPGDSAFKPMKEYKEYAEFKEFTMFSYLGSAETPRKYESFLEAGAQQGLMSDVKVNIIFCDEKDALMESAYQRYVLETAEDIEREFPDIIKVQYVNIWTNPGAVQRFKTNALTNIYSTNVIIESGTEFRIYSLNSFFIFNDTNSNEPWSYNGEKKFASGILSVIKAESPIACVTINHGEALRDYELLNLLGDAGYKVQALNLATEEIPEDCRLMVVCNPTSDFMVKDGISDVSEIAKLNEWLDEFNSLMVFMSPDTPVLPNFEEYLEEWGIKYDRYTDEDGNVYPYMIKDNSQSLTADGMTVVGEYTTKGLGASIHKEMRSVSVPPKVVFKNAMPISYADNYKITNYVNEDDPDDTYRYGSYYSNGVSRNIYDVFTTSPNADAIANGEHYKERKGDDKTKLDPYKLMTITRETQMVSNQDADYSYVIACSSTDFVNADMLQSVVYGNSDVLISALRSVGRESVVVNLAHKPFDKPKIESLTTAQANRYTIILTVIPAVVVIALGIFVVVRRKYA